MLAVGDEAFQRKCDEFFTEIKKDANKTVILVTHDMDSVRKYCSRAMMIADGEVEAIGDPETVSQQYTLANLNAEEAVEQQKREERGGYPNGLNERCPILRTYAISPRICKSSDTFRLLLNISMMSHDDFYIAICIA